MGGAKDQSWNPEFQSQMEFCKCYLWWGHRQSDNHATFKQALMKDMVGCIIMFWHGTEGLWHRNPSLCHQLRWMLECHLACVSLFVECLWSWKWDTVSDKVVMFLCETGRHLGKIKTETTWWKRKGFVDSFSCKSKDGKELDDNEYVLCLLM